MVQGDARRRHRGHPRRGLQPHRRGQPPRPDAELQGHRQPGVLPARRGRRSSYYMDYTGTGNSLNVRHPHSLQLIMDSLRYWVTEMHVDGFRFDLAADAGARVLRRRPAVDVLRARAAGPGRQPGEADRRAVGRRPRRLPGRQLPAPVDRVERRLPRHRARLLARRAVAGRVRLAGWPAPPTSTSTPVADRSPASTSSPPTTASRCATWCPTTRSTTRPTARTTTTARATTARGTTASRARPTTRRSSRPRAREQRNFLATLLLSQGVPMLLHGDELGRTQDGNNNTYAQDSEISWVHWDDADKPLDRVHRGRRQAARRPPDLPPQALLHRQHGAHRRRRAPQRHRLAAPRRPSRWRTATGRAAAQAIGMYLNGDGIAGKDARGRHHHRRPLPALLQRRRPGAGDPAAGGVRRGVGRRHRHRRRRRRRPDARGRGDVRRSTPAAVVVLREHAEPEAEPDHSVAASLAARSGYATLT